MPAGRPKKKESELKGHRSNAFRCQRRDEELAFSPDGSVIIPDMLDEMPAARSMFKLLAGSLIRRGTWDVSYSLRLADCCKNFIRANEYGDKAYRLANGYDDCGESEASSLKAAQAYSNMQKAAFGMARQTASDLGLDINGALKAVPSAPKEGVKDGTIF